MAKGQKACSCGLTCGPRTKVCKCGKLFEFKTKKIIAKIDPTTIIKPRVVRNFVYSGSKCPVPLPTKEEHYKKWLDKIQCHRSNDLLYTRQAIIQFALSDLKLVKFIKLNMDEYPDAIYENECFKQYCIELQRRPRKRYV